MIACKVKVKSIKITSLRVSTFRVFHRLLKYASTNMEAQKNHNWGKIKYRLMNTILWKISVRTFTGINCFTTRSLQLQMTKPRPLKSNTLGRRCQLRSELGRVQEIASFNQLLTLSQMLEIKICRSWRQTACSLSGFDRHLARGNTTSYPWTHQVDPFRLARPRRHRVRDPVYHQLPQASELISTPRVRVICLALEATEEPTLLYPAPTGQNMPNYPASLKESKVLTQVTITLQDRKVCMAAN